MTAIGELTRRLVLQQPVGTPDGAGGVTRAYAPVTTLWASVEPISARGVVVAGAPGATVTHRISIRWRSDVTTRYRLVDGARVYRIVSMRDQDAGRFLLIHAEHRAD
jgi:SPP1 family predicted phage head-tail adaptor